MNEAIEVNLARPDPRGSRERVENPPHTRPDWLYGAIGYKNGKECQDGVRTYVHPEGCDDDVWWGGPVSSPPHSRLLRNMLIPSGFIVGMGKKFDSGKRRFLFRNATINFNWV